MTHLPAAAPVAASRPLPRRVGLALAALFLGLGWFSERFGGANGIAMAEWLPSATLFAVLALGTGATGMLATHRRAWSAVTAAVCSVLAAIILVAGHGAGTSFHQGSHRSPDASREVVVVSSSDGPQRDVLRLRELQGPTSRYWQLGCVDTTRSSITSVRWEGKDTVVVGVDRTPHRVHVGPHGPGKTPAQLHSC